MHNRQRGAGNSSVSMQHWLKSERNISSPLAPIIKSCISLRISRVTTAEQNYVSNFAAESEAEGGAISASILPFVNELLLCRLAQQLLSVIDERSIGGSC